MDKLKVFAVNLIDSEQGCYFTFIQVGFKPLDAIRAAKEHVKETNQCPYHDEHRWQAGGSCELDVDDILKALPPKPKEPELTTKSAVLNLIIKRKDKAFFTKFKHGFSKSEQEYIKSALKT
jgi:hypothetical protein